MSDIENDFTEEQKAFYKEAVEALKEAKSLIIKAKDLSRKNRLYMSSNDIAELLNLGNRESDGILAWDHSGNGYSTCW